MHAKYCTLYQHIYSRIVIQLNMYVKIITSSGFKSTILADIVQGQLRVPFRFGRCLKFPGSTLIYQMLSSPPQALRLRERLDTKWKKNRSRIYDLGVVPTRPEVIEHPIERLVARVVIIPANSAIKACTDLSIGESECKSICNVCVRD